MDFFERQERAQQKTTLLITYFVLAVVGIIVVLQIVFSILLGLPWNDPELFAWVGGGTLLFVIAGSAFKTAELSQGGRVVATSLGGEPISPHTKDPGLRRLMNIVEEMSIASGVPVPEVFVLPDPAINAFAAGHGPGDAAIGVTRGAIERLSRDELQGVIAHEFSHLLHGDMKLNVRLIGLLHGILCIALAGALLLRITIYLPSDSGGSREGDRRGGGGIILILLAAGLALYIVGWIGVFFGNLIKAAVSRQREFLADASAVQYTRNPHGIAGALWKIGKFTSRLAHPRATEASHMFFGDGVGHAFLQLFATHPPIPERIAAIAPDFNPSQKESLRSSASAPPPDSPASQTGRPLPAASLLTAVSLPLESGAGWLAALPEFLAAAIHETGPAGAIICTLLLDRDENIRARQLEVLPPPLRELATHFDARRHEIESIPRLILVDLALPALRYMSDVQYRQFRETIVQLVAADGQIAFFEFVLQKVLMRHLDMYFTKHTGPTVKYRSLVRLLPEAGTLLTAVALVGHKEPEARREAFDVGVRELLVKPSSYPLEVGEHVDLSSVDAALDRFAQASPEVQRLLINACSQCAAHDGVLEIQEYELLRAISDVLGYPAPPPPPPPLIVN